MHPVLLTIGPVTLYTFGVFVLLAFFVAVFIIWFFGRREGFEEEKILDTILVTSIMGILGGRIFWFLGHPHLFSVLSFFRIFRIPGFTFLGAVFGGLIGLFWYSLRIKWNFLKFADIVILGLSFGEGIGRIGCFLSGTAFGRQTYFYWGVSQVGLLKKRHPVQLLESLSCFLIFYVLFKLKTKRRFAGFLVFSYFFLLGFEKFLLEFLKEEGVYWGRLKAAQIVGLVTATLSGGSLYKKTAKEPRENLESLFGLILYRLGRERLRFKNLWLKFQNWAQRLLKR
jgi:phosphatidylglycerol:prolipoprotein diacylglycerol transferase